MKSVLPAFVAVLLAAQPLAAQSLTVLLPAITFPEPTVTLGSKACDAATPAPVCQIEE